MTISREIHILTVNLAIAYRTHPDVSLLELAGQSPFTPPAIFNRSILPRHEFVLAYIAIISLVETFLHPLSSFGGSLGLFNPLTSIPAMSTVF
jgi:hypothetical protein